MDIFTTLNKVVPYNAQQSYSDFANVMKDAYIELSFWGGRNVYAIGYEGSIPLGDIAQIVMDLVESHPEFNERERKLGLIVQDKIRSLYNISEHQVEKANIITRIFITLREIFTPVTESVDERVFESNRFDYCTANQYTKITGKDPYLSNPNSLFYRNKLANIGLLGKEDADKFATSVRISIY